MRVALTPAQLANLDRFQAARGLASQDAALRLLLDIAFEAVTSTGRRFWDQKLTTDDASVAQARILAARLREEGHTEAAEKLQTETAGERIGHALLEALRETCQTILTTIEALDPKTQLLAEELRLEIDTRLSK